MLKEHLTRGHILNRQRFEENARELEAAMALVRKASGSEAPTTDQNRGLVDVIARYTLSVVDDRGIESLKIVLLEVNHARVDR